MINVHDTKRKRPLPVLQVAGFVLSAIVAVGAFATLANAQRWDGYHRQDRHLNWNGGYYRAPPVVYGSVYGSGYYGTPYYYPPVVYGPSVVMPGLVIQVR